MSTEHELWTLDEVAAHLRVSRRTVERLTYARQLGVVRRGRRVLVRRAEIERFIDDHTLPALPGLAQQQIEEGGAR